MKPRVRVITLLFGGFLLAAPLAGETGVGTCWLSGR